MPDRFRVLQDQGRRLVLSGELDIAAAGVLMEAVRDVTDGEGPITLDLAQVTFIDSTGLRTLIGAAREREGLGPLVIERPSAQVVEILEIAGIIGSAPNLVLKDRGDGPEAGSAR